MNSSGYKEVEHIADIAIMVWAEDFYSLLKQCAEGMYAVMGVEGNPEIIHNEKFFIEKETPETVVVDFLNEILYFSQANDVIFRDFTFHDDKKRLHVHGTGYKLMSISREIKAVTFHDLEIAETENGFTTRITFDV